MASRLQLANYEHRPIKSTQWRARNNTREYMKITGIPREPLGPFSPAAPGLPYKQSFKMFVKSLTVSTLQ